MDFYNSFQEFCEKNNLTRSQGIEFLEKELKREGDSDDKCSIYS